MEGTKQDGVIRTPEVEDETLDAEKLHVEKEKKSIKGPALWFTLFVLRVTFEAK